MASGSRQLSNQTAFAICNESANSKDELLLNGI